MNIHFESYDNKKLELCE